MKWRRSDQLDAWRVFGDAAQPCPVGGARGVGLGVHRLAGVAVLAAASLLDSDAPADPVERLDIVTENIARQILEHEAELRAMLRLSLDPDVTADRLPLRQGRALGIEDALTPLRQRIPEPDLRTLALAIRATIGIEALVWLTDVGALSRQQACDVMRSSARAVLQAKLTEAPDTNATVT